MIQNPGVAPIEGFTVFGLSSTRKDNNEQLIGQFGSGNKHAINLLLRKGAAPHVFLGKRHLQFFAKPAVMQDELGSTDYMTVNINDDGKITDLGFALEYGEIDWKNLSMALREFVSNAIDRTIREFNSYKHDDLIVEMVEIPEGKEGVTRIFVPVDTDVSKFYAELPIRFLQFSGSGNISKSIIRKVPPKVEVSLGNPEDTRSGEGDRQPRIYRNGVYIRQHGELGLFDYNFGRDLKIDESRNLSDYHVREAAFKLLQKCGSVDDWMHLFEHITNNPKSSFFEANFMYYSHHPITDETIVRVKEAWQRTVGAAVLLKCSNLITADFVHRKGYVPVGVCSESWFSFLNNCGVKTDQDILTSDERDGKVVSVKTVDVNEVFESVWARLWGCNLIPFGCEKPELCCFDLPANGETKLNGEYRNGKVYIHKDIADGKSKLLYKVMLEEVAHHITGSDDRSYDIQEFMGSAAVAFGGFCD
jgi:hypothetical protein